MLLAFIRHPSPVANSLRFISRGSGVRLGWPDGHIWHMDCHNSGARDRSMNCQECQGFFWSLGGRCFQARRRIDCMEGPGMFLEDDVLAGASFDRLPVRVLYQETVLSGFWLRQTWCRSVSARS
jgi:hypothetical protein